MTPKFRGRRDRASIGRGSLGPLLHYSSFNASRRFQSARSRRDRALSRSHLASCETRPIARSRSFWFVAGGPLINFRPPPPTEAFPPVLLYSAGPFFPF